MKTQRHMLKVQRRPGPGGYRDLGERLRSKAKGERWDLIPGEESKFDNGIGELVTVSCVR